MYHAWLIKKYFLYVKLCSILFYNFELFLIILKYGYNLHVYQITLQICAICRHKYYLLPTYFLTFLSNNGPKGHLEKCMSRKF